MLYNLTDNSYFEAVTWQLFGGGGEEGGGGGGGAAKAVMVSFICCSLNFISKILISVSPKLV